MISPNDPPTRPDTGLVSRLQAFVAGSDEGETVLPWSARLSPRDRERLRADLAVILSEPEATGEPLDWPEITSILEEWASAAEWDGPLLPAGDTPTPGLFTLDIRAREQKALSEAPPVVQRAARQLLDEFLVHHPTDGQRLARGQIKKLKNRDIWQIDLPDGYRLRFYIDKPHRTVYVVYLGPHPEGEARGREAAVRSRVHSQRRWEG